MAEDVANLEVWKRLVAILKPNYGEVEFLEEAAKRCAAKARKFDEWKWRIREYQRWWRDHWRDRELQKLNLKETQVEARMISQYNSALRREVRNWKHKAEKIARALGIREGETLVDAAERVARLKSINYETAKTALGQLADDDALRKRVEEAEAEIARLKKALEDQAQATEQGRELVGPWIVERDEWKARAASFERIANELQAQLNSKALETGRCSCGTALIDATAKGDKAVHDYCSTCQRLYPSSIKEYVDNFAKWSGMSMAKVEPHSEPPTAWE